MRPLIAILLRILAPARSVGRVATLATLVFFTVGAALACVWVISSAPPTVLALVVAVLAVLAVLSLWSRSTPVRALAVGVLVTVHFFWLYVAVSLGVLLAWTTPVPIRVGAALLALLAIWGAVPPRARFRLPLALPFGVWIASCLMGWWREDGVIRCDDYFAARASGAAIVVPTTDELDRCQAGESLRVGHYPRRVWEAPDGERLVITTQLGIGRLMPPGREVADRLAGIVCEAPIGDAPSCFGTGKAQDIVESIGRDRLFVAGWQQRFPDGSRGILYMLPRTGPLRPLAAVPLSESVAELFYEPNSDTVGLLSDEGEVMRPVRVSDGMVLEAIPAPIDPGESHYDELRHEGIFCLGAGPLRQLDGRAFLSIAFRGDPFSFRPLGSAEQNPTAWLSMVWGCDWDPLARRAYVADASLGLLTVVDYDSGRVLRRIPIDLGIRYVSLDRERNLVYLANFLRGDIVALDLDSGHSVARWFAGRFVRQVVLARDRRSLLVTSNLGVLRIPIDNLRTAAPDGGARPN